MRRLLLGLSLFYLLFGTLFPWAALGQGEMAVLSDSHEYRFGEHITFRLEVQGAEPIQEIVLIYRVEGTPAANRGIPAFTPGNHVAAQFTWHLQRGQLPPASDIEYHWQIRDAQGRTLKTEPERFLYHDDRFDWQSLTEGGITLYWYNKPEGFARSLMASTQKALSQIEERIGLVYTRTAKVVVYLDKDDMLKALVPTGERHEQAMLTLGTLVSRDTLLIHGTHPEVADTLVHELTHLVVHQATENPFGDIPAWLDEGLAMYAQGLPSGHRATLAQAIRGDRLISLRSLLGMAGKVEEVELFYAESYSVVDFLAKSYDKEKLVQLLGAFRRGLRQEEALSEVYSLTTEELEARWRESLGLRPDRAEVAATATPQAIAIPTPGGGEPRLCASLLPGIALLALGGLLSLRRGRLGAG